MHQEVVVDQELEAVPHQVKAELQALQQKRQANEDLRTIKTSQRKAQRKTSNGAKKSKKTSRQKIEDILNCKTMMAKPKYHNATAAE